MDNLIRKYKIQLGILLNCFNEHDIETQTKLRLGVRVKMCREFIEELENLKKTGESNE